MTSIPGQITIEGNTHPTFIGCWQIDNKKICQDIIDFFEVSKNKQRQGTVTGSRVVKSAKNSTDITVEPNDLKLPEYSAIVQYMDALHACYQDYLKTWDFLGYLLSRAHIGRFNIQKYDAGGHFRKLHTERTSMDTTHRVLAWMTYLNDVPEGGETTYPHYDLSIKPEQGKTLIWPAEWTHAHLGGVVTVGPKYIITGWINFPD